MQSNEKQLDKHRNAQKKTMKSNEKQWKAMRNNENTRKNKKKY